MSASQTLQKQVDAEAVDLQRKTDNINTAYQAFAKNVPQSADWAHLSKDKVNKLNNELQNLRMMIDASTGELTNYEQNVGAMMDLHEVAKKSQERESLLKEYQEKGVELQKEIQKLGKLIHIASNQIDQQVEQISKDKQQVQNYEELIRSRAHVIATRDRMLQLSQERNMYKKKVIYVLLAIIIGILIAIIATYNIFTKSRS